MFHDDTVENAWIRSRGRCECACSTHGHRQPCGCALDWDCRGNSIWRGGWEAYRKGGPTLLGWEAVNQCEILCWSCYEQAALCGKAAPYVVQCGGCDWSGRFATATEAVAHAESHREELQHSQWKMEYRASPRSHPNKRSSAPVAKGRQRPALASVSLENSVAHAGAVAANGASA